LQKQIKKSLNKHRLQNNWFSKYSTFYKLHSLYDYMYYKMINISVWNVNKCMENDE